MNHIYICRSCGDWRPPPPYDFPGESEPLPGDPGGCDLHDWAPVDAADAALASVADETRVWVLGAPDPEMQLIEYLLVVAGERIAYALAADGQRVHPGNAYRAVALSAPVPDGAAVYAVECGGPAIPAGAVAIDHHRPGDPGYGRPPEYFLPASSIGQVIAELARLENLPWPQWGGIHTLRRAGEFCGPGEPPVTATEQEIRGTWHVAAAGTGIRNGVRAVPIPTPYVLAAAADHCLAAAYRGECPGVEPDALMRWRVAVRAAHQGRPVDELLDDVEQARARLRAAPVVALGERLAARDLRGKHVPELPEAAVREGMAYLATVTDRDGRQKIVLGGHADAEMVQAFMERWAPREGLVDLYGDPARGFAGGYVAGLPGLTRQPTPPRRRLCT